MSSKNKMVKNADNSPVFSGMIDKQTVNKDCFECVSDAKKENDAKKKEKNKFMDSSWHYFKRWSGKTSLRKRHLN